MGIIIIIYNFQTTLIISSSYLVPGVLSTLHCHDDPLGCLLRFPAAHRWYPFKLTGTYLCLQGSLPSVGSSAQSRKSRKTRPNFVQGF